VRLLINIVFWQLLKGHGFCGLLQNNSLGWPGCFSFPTTEIVATVNTPPPFLIVGRYNEKDLASNTVFAVKELWLLVSNFFSFPSLFFPRK
jgi:hypothetical protein